MLDTILWIAQSFLALFFFAAGLPKVLGRGLDRWVGFDDLPRPLVVVTGAGEVAAAVALLAPTVVARVAWAAPLAATGLAAVSLMASGFHIREREWLPAVETSLWASLAASIAIGRWGGLSTVPALPTRLLIPVIAVLVPVITVVLVLLFRRQSRIDIEDEEAAFSPR
jgi:hypothetical protein